MICVTGREPTARALEARLEAVRECPELRGKALLLEVRLDALERLDEEVFGLLRHFAAQVVACCRPERQGGWFQGPERERLEALGRAVEAGVAWVDLEADLSEEELARFPKQPATRRLLSWHDFQGLPARPAELLEGMARRGVDGVKLAARVEDAADLAVLSTAGSGLGLPAVILGMGEAGGLSRCRYRGFGSAWTYVAADEAQATAPGQLGLRQALELGLPGSAEEPFIGLLGGPQALRSPGMRVYNRLFRRRGLPWSYVPVISARAAEAVELARSLGAVGLSVTMPHKRAALELGRPDELALQAEAANSVRFDSGGALCTNTDVEGVAEPLRQALGPGGAMGHRALILGAGGAARSAMLACRSIGLLAVLCARSNGDSEVPWELRSEVEASVLVNATPVGGAGASPWPPGRPLRKRVVFDLAMTGERSALLEQAEKEGALALGPEEMWIVQGSRQMSWITGERFSAAELREALA